jgi:Dolichyl-phosphate-mannose-protein mannosyltransferase
MTQTSLRERSFERSDVWWMLGLTSVALAFRLAYFSGYGLGDDVIFRTDIAAIVRGGTVVPDNSSYRITWWLPTVLSCRIFGLNELGLIVPITAMATIGILVVYAFGKSLWGRPGAVIATLLLTVFPLDFAWSTMFTNDFYVAVLSAVTVLLVLQASREPRRLRRRGLWILAGVSLLAAYHAKVSAILIVPAIAIICWTRRRELDREFAYFLLTTGVLTAVSCFAWYRYAGDPFWPYHSETQFSGVTGPDALLNHPLSRDVFLTYPRLLAWPDHLGDRLYSLYPHLLLALAIVGPLLRIRTSGAVFWWFLFVALGLQFAVNHVPGGWTSGARNVRHTLIFVYPMTLLLTGYVVGLWGRFPKLTSALLGALLVYGALQCVSTATKTKVAYADRRQALEFITGLPPRPIYSDFQLCTYALLFDFPPGMFPCKELTGDESMRRAEIAAIPFGYLVTGGGREPHYGCFECIPQAADVPEHGWRLLAHLPGPDDPVPWRPEPLRVWERVQDGTSLR